MKTGRRGFFGLAGRGALAAAAYMAAAPTVQSATSTPSSESPAPIVGERGPEIIVPPAYTVNTAVFTSTLQSNHSHDVAMLGHTHAIADHMHTNPGLILKHTHGGGGVPLGVVAYHTGGTVPLPPGWRPAPELDGRFVKGSARP